MPPLSRAQVRAILAPCRAALPSLRDATYTLTRREYVQGRLLPLEVLFIRYRAPGDLHLRWVGGAHKGRQVLYRPDHDGGRLRIKAGRLVPTIKLDPRSPVALRQSRSPVWMASIAAVQAAILDQDAYLDAHDTRGAHFDDLGIQPIGGVPARGYRALLPKGQDPSLYAQKVEVWLSQATPTLAGVRVWDIEDGALRMVEDHTFSDLKLNTGLTPGDFEPRRAGL